MMNLLSNGLFEKIKVNKKVERNEEKLKSYSFTQW
jgi:hypothetical protein